MLRSRRRKGACIMNVTCVYTVLVRVYGVNGPDSARDPGMEVDFRVKLSCWCCFQSLSSVFDDALGAPRPHGSPRGNRFAITAFGSRLFCETGPKPSEKFRPGYPTHNVSISVVRHYPPTPPTPFPFSNHFHRYLERARVGYPQDSHFCATNLAFTRLCAARTRHGTRTHGCKIF